MLLKTETALLAFMDRLPPVLVRAMAVECGKGKTPKLKSLGKIIEDSGLPRRTVQRIIYQPSWKNIKVEVASKFISACGLDIMHKRQAYQFARQWGSKNFPHLSTAQKTRLFDILGWK